MFRFIFLLLLLFLFVDARAQQEIRLAYSDTESYPYQLGTGAKVASPPGIAIDIIKTAAEKVGIRVIFERYSNRLILNHLHHGVIDGVFIFSYLKEREVFGVYPMKAGLPDINKRIAQISYFLYRNKGAKADWDGERFTPEGVSVATQSGFSINAMLRAHRLAVAEVQDVDQLYRLLKSGRIDAVATQDILLEPYIKVRQITDIERDWPPLETRDYYLVLSHQFYRKHAQLAEKLWQEVANARKTLLPDIRPISK
ncbi:transporter substrate-binding domain-containing protein [Thalassomonas actiniarum]|uniref:Transporter substrate-binding domain-containing protein n=1 Tax=Thalassomonas actiniarum TaxID=485447 RepID=A0AAF0C348_9GAMM|nr:transporter substrate-binding domain-containing protein [Thalassomonas actiniarum]WDD98560.1 transporter substrate-binding domain-containing protein [Thalassomonas actiniarum]